MEEFKRITAHPDYDVNTSGVVRSWKSGKPVVLTPHTTKNGYRRIGLSINGKTQMCFIHRLVALTFIPNPDNKPQINHINGIKTDNRVENLEWATAKENRHHAVITGLNPQGESHGSAKLTNEQAVYIRNNPDGLTCTELAAKFGVDKTTTSLIQRGKTFKTVGGTVRDKFGVPDDVREEIRRQYQKDVYGCGCHVLAEKFGVNKSTVLNIIRDLPHGSQQPPVPAAVREEIRRLYVKGSHEFGCYGLAEKFGVSAATVCNIVKDPHRKPKPPRVPDDVREEIRRLYAQGGISQSALAEKFGIGQTTVGRIIHEAL